MYEIICLRNSDQRKPLFDPFPVVPSQKNKGEWKNVRRILGGDDDGYMLVSGDVHRTRVIRHLSVKMAGYRTPELTTSPVHSGVIDNSNQPHPGLIFDCSTGNTFPLLTSSQRGAQAKLNTRFITKDGKTFFQQTYLARRLQKR
ncbi:MAG: hypothetical protein MK329_09390 [Pirellulales bacterium]|nr:hypothetical protein [Pirellulales bacterium]